MVLTEDSLALSTIGGDGIHGGKSLWNIEQFSIKFG